MAFFILLVLHSWLPLRKGKLIMKISFCKYNLNMKWELSETKSRRNAEVYICMASHKESLVEQDKEMSVFHL